MKILVTGGAGFIGSNITDALIEEGHELAVLDNLSTGDKHNINKEATFFKADLSDISSIKKVFKQFNPEFIIHCAAQTNVRESMENPVYDASQNIINSINLLEVMREFDIKRILYLSSGGAIYDEDTKFSEEGSKIKPKCPYGVSKFTVEKYLWFYQNIYGFNPKILRLSNVYGPRNKNGVIRLFADKIKAGKPIIIIGGEQIRDFVHVNDVIEAVKTVFNYIGVYNVGTGRGVTINVLRKKMYNIYNIKENILDIRKNFIQGEALFSCLNINKLKYLGWKPKITLEEGLKLID